MINRFGVWLVTGGILALALTAPVRAVRPGGQAVAAPGGDAAALVRDAFATLDRSQLAEARKQFEAAVAAARAQQNRAAEADALRGLGAALYQAGRWTDAPKPLDEARAIYVERGDRLGEARTLDLLGSIGAMTRKPDADDLYRRAIELFAAAGAPVDQARTMRNRSHLTGIALADKIPMLQQAFGLAEGDRRLQGLILHSWGVLIQTQGRYAEALERFERARPLLDEAGSPRERARLLSSMAASFQMHGLSPRAIEGYLEALALLEQIGDVPGQSQTSGLLAEAYRSTGQVQRSLDMRKRALELAEKTGSPGLIDYGARQPRHRLPRGEGLSQRHRNRWRRRSARIASPTPQPGSTATSRWPTPAPTASTMRCGSATRGVDVARERERTQIEMGSLQVRAQVYEQAGRVNEAIADARAGLDALERLRGSLGAHRLSEERLRRHVPGALRRRPFRSSHTGRTSGEALAVAEQARARGFLDLLASRERRPATAAAAGPGRQLRLAGAGDRGHGRLTHARRHPARAGGARRTWPAQRSAPVPTADTLQHVGGAAGVHGGGVLGRRRRHVRVGDDARRPVTSHRVPVTRARLSRLVRQTWSMSDSQMTSRGDRRATRTPSHESDGRPGPAAARRPAAPSQRVEVPDHARRRSAWRSSGRGAVRLPRAVYDLLIRPIRGALPSAGREAC